MPLDATADPFDALGAGTAPQAPAAAASPAPRVGPASIQLPQVAGSVPLGNGEYGIGQGAAPVASDDGVIDVMGAHEVPAAAPPPKPAAAHADPFDALGAGTKPPAGTVPVTPTASLNPTAAAPPARSGYIANMGAGTSEAVAGLLGMPVDTVTAIANLVPRGINAVAGTNLPTIQEPVGGSQSIEKAMGLIGANPQDVTPATPGEALTRAGARGAAGVALPGGIARGFVGPAAQALAAGGGVGGAVAGAGGGVTGYAASKSVPPEYAPLADTLGNIVGGGLTAGGEAFLSAFGRVGAKAYQAMRQPMNLGAREPLIDPATGQPFPNGPATATAGQQTLAGRQIVAASGQTPAELSAAIPPAANATLVPGSRPSLGQATGNLGVLGLERQQRNLNRTPYTEAEAANSVARVRALQGLAGPQEAGAAAGQFFSERLAHLRVLEDALERSAADTARRVTHQIGGNPAETGEQELGAAHRAALEALRGPVKAAAGRLYDAIDPDGTLALRVTAVRDAARKMLQEVNARMGGGMSPEESGVVAAAAGMRDVELFSDLRELDSNLAAAQREIRTNPKLGTESKPFARVTALRRAIDDAMAEGAADEAKVDAEAATADPDRATVGKTLAAEAEQWRQERAAGTADARNGASGAGNPPAGGVGGVLGVGGSASEAGAESGSATANRPVATAPAALEPNFSPEDRAALRTANRAYADYKNTFRRGAVGDVLASATGPTGFRMAESGVPKALFRGGPQGSEAADSLIRAAGSPEAAVKLLGDYPAFAFRRAAETDGMIDPGKAAKWLDANKAALDKLPGLREKFADAAKAGAAVEKAAADGADRIKAMQDSAARHYLTKGGEAVEPQAAIGKLLASPTAPKDAAAMMRTAERAGNQAAIDGIKRNLVDYLLTKARSTAEAGTTGEKEIAGGVFQRWIANPSNAGVVRAVLGPEGADMVAKVAEDIERAARAVNATKIPGSPGTAADLISHAAGGHGLSVLGQVLVGQIAGEMIEGGVGGMELGGAMAGAMMALNAMRLAGMRNVDDLVTAGLLNPELGRLLISKAAIADKPAILKRLLNRIAAVGVGASSAKGKN